VWSRFRNYVISYILDWLIQTVCIICFCCLATVKKAYSCWSGLVILNQLFFVARQRQDVLRHSGHVLFGNELDSVFAVFWFHGTLDCYVCVNVQIVKCLLQSMRHYSRHAALPTVILRFMKTLWNTLALSTQNLIKWMKIKNTNELIIHSNGNWLYVYHTLLEGPLDLKVLGLSLHSLLVNPTLSIHNLRVTTQNLIWQCSVFRTTLLIVMKQKQDALLVYQKRKFCLHKAFKTLILAIPAINTAEFCAFVCLKNERNVASWSHSISYFLLTIYNCA